MVRASATGRRPAGRLPHDEWTRAESTGASPARSRGPSYAICIGALNGSLMNRPAETGTSGSRWTAASAVWRATSSASNGSSANAPGREHRLDRGEHRLEERPLLARARPGDDECDASPFRSLGQFLGGADLRRAGDGDLEIERVVLRRSPVDDLLDDRVLAVHAMVDRPDAAAPAGGRLVDPDRRRPATAAGAPAT